jgi:hypothetical protein
MTDTQRQDDDRVRWLALLIRQGLKLIVAGIERRYGLGCQKDVIESA